jgi:hypothetical protein
MQPVEAAEEAQRTSWTQRLWSLIFVVFCFELGVFLIVFPWLDYWNNNSIASLSPWLREMWDNPYFRGALSGLGFVNVYISLAEVFRLRRPPTDKMVSTL